jgi:hypothetical protein
MRKALVLLVFTYSLSISALAQNTAAGLAGVGAGAALGTSAGQSATTPSSAVAGGSPSSSAPIEIQIMAFNGMQKISRDLVRIIEINGCKLKEDSKAELDLDANNKPQNCKPIVLDDPPLATQLALYESVEGYVTNMSQLYSSFEKNLALLVVPQSLTFPTQVSASIVPEKITITNTGMNPINVGEITVTGPQKSYFVLGDKAPLTQQYDCPIALKRNDSCVVTVSVLENDTDKPKTVTAALNIPNPSSKSVQIVQLTATLPAKGTTTTSKEYQEFLRSEIAAVAPAAPAAPSTTTPSTSGGSQTPVSMQYLSGISSALAAVKNGITYTPTSFQPTTQAFENLIESDLHEDGIAAYSSTSALNLSKAAVALSESFAEMLVMGSDITNWANQCKLTNGNTTPTNGQSMGQSPALNPECNNANVVVELAAAQQMITTYSNLLQSPSDGNGNPVIVDLLRGEAIWEKVQPSFLSLQVSVAAGGGSTRANNFFLLDLFYTPKPSYNSGVIATFEIRDEDNKLLASGARNVLYDYVGYTTWKPGSFAASEVKKPKDRECGSFCGEN